MCRNKAKTFSTAGHVTRLLSLGFLIIGLKHFIVLWELFLCRGASIIISKEENVNSYLFSFVNPVL